MDIKGLVRSLVPLASSTNTAQAVALKKRTETGSASDRDANGRQEQPEEQTKRHLEPQEIEDAIKYLQSLQGVKDNNLTVRLEEGDGTKVVYIEDPTGKVVRRLAEPDLFTILKGRKDNAQPKTSGNLLNKSA